MAMRTAQLITRQDESTRQVSAIPNQDRPVQDFFDSEHRQEPLRPATQGLFELSSRLPGDGFMLIRLRLDDGDRLHSDSIEAIEDDVKTALVGNHIDRAFRLIRTWPNPNLAPMYAEFLHMRTGSIIRLTRDGGISAAGADNAFNEFVAAVRKSVEARRSASQ